MRLGAPGRVAFALALIMAATLPVRAQHTFDGNIVFGNNPTNCTTGGSATFDGCALLNTLFTHNDQVNPQLGDPFNIANPNWVPAETSPAKRGNDDVVNVIVRADACNNCSCPPSQIQSVCWRGAVPPASMGPDWTQGWTDYTLNGAGRVYPVRPVVVLTGAQSSSVHMTAANHYLLRGRVNFLAGTTLRIDPGVYVFGENSTTGFLVIERGARIEAIGTKDQPIVMTSDQVPGSMSPGGWGGVVINGRAISNCADCVNGASCVSEGTEVLHCGNLDCDDSGIVSYTRVEFAGLVVGANNELNAWTFNSLGCGTTLRFLAANRGLDDLFEWFGGKVEAKYLVGTAGQDDGLDWQMGWRGGVQFAVILQLGDNSDKGIEADNNEFSFDAPCRSNPTVANVTLLATGGGTSTHGIHFRRGTDAQLYNSIVMGWPSTGIRVQDNATSARGTFADPGVLQNCATSNVDEGDLAESFVVRTFPNPVVREARFFFDLPASGPTSVRIFDSNGRLIDTPLASDLAAGQHSVTWTLPQGTPSGAYFYRVENAGQVATGRLVTTR